MKTTIFDTDKRHLSEQPDRSYQIPGGPYAAKLGKTEVKVLAEFKRGSEDDQGYGGKR